MVTASLIVVGGGARSGKSAFALNLAERLGRRRAFIATAALRDAEMERRVLRHRRERGEAFDTFEAPLDVVERVATLRGYEVLLLDCLTLAIANQVLASEQRPDEYIEGAVDVFVRDLLEAIAAQPATVVVVTNEVGMGIVPDTRLGRLFRDVAGRANQRCAAAADELYLAVLGTVLRVRPAPVEACEVVSG